jgi:hypothetical protein
MAADKDKEIPRGSQDALIAAIRAKFEEDRQILISTLEQRLQAL